KKKKKVSVTTVEGHGAYYNSTVGWDVFALLVIFLPTGYDKLKNVFALVLVCITTSLVQDYPRCGRRNRA
ncbi:unnamed protein product, partial [Ectocarpus sp. 13 AM-2016]